MQLYRPVGIKELRLIAANRFKAYPPRLPQQPIFYPVLNQEYAEYIAKEWNTKDIASGFAGFVTMFEIDDPYARQFKVQTVGNQTHQELWVPAEELEEFNRHIIDRIQVINAFYGPQCEEKIDPHTNMPIL